MVSLCKWFSQKRITCLLGAGATMPLGGPTTRQITEAARHKTQHVIDPATGQWSDVQFIDQVAARLDNFLAPAQCHFEDIFHVLEGLDSLRAGWNTSTGERFKPRLAAFVEPADPRWFDPMWLIAAKTSLLEAVAEQVEQSLTVFQPDGAHRWFRDFWSTALSASAWDIATLNYDNVLEQMSPDLEDGFGSPTSWSRFDKTRLRGTKKSRILHLHGSIHYGYLPPHQERRFIDYGEDLCKFSSPSEARQTWFGRSTHTAQSHEEAVIGPLITGLRKTDKLTVHPYDDYQALFRHRIEKSPRLLIAGYSFGDLYLNSIMNRMLGIHGSKRRIAIVTWFPGQPDEWHCDPQVLHQDWGWPTHEMHFAFGALMNSVTPFGTSLSFRDRLVSDDQCCRIYLGGTQPAFQNYSDEILAFLSS
jgi:hypothetical protein